MIWISLMDNIEYRTFYGLIRFDMRDENDGVTSLMIYELNINPFDSDHLELHKVQQAHSKHLVPFSATHLDFLVS